MSNAATSRTSPYSNNIITHIPRAKRGVYLYIKYTKGGGTSVALVPTFIDPSINASDAYQQAALDTSYNVSAITYTFSASGNYRLPIPMSKREGTLILTFTFTGGTDQVIVCDVREE